MCDREQQGRVPVDTVDHGGWTDPVENMLIIFGGLIVGTVLTVVVRTWAFTTEHPLGLMSERWVAEHRAAEHL
jgi:hypothetical protein